MDIALLGLEQPWPTITKSWHELVLGICLDWAPAASPVRRPNWRVKVYLPLIFLFQDEVQGKKALKLDLSGKQLDSERRSDMFKISVPITVLDHFLLHFIHSEIFIHFLLNVFKTDESLKRNWWHLRSREMRYLLVNFMLYAKFVLWKSNSLFKFAVKTVEVHFI